MRAWRLRPVWRRPALCELDDAGLDLDIDHPADYEKAVQLFAKQPD
jgi:CTP:molybdopterin cytidylyltransferase MocA